MIQSKISQIFTLKNTTLAVYTLTSAIVLINPSKAFALNCDETRTVTTPFTWSLTQTTGSGKNNISVFQRNDGPAANVESSNATLAGNFKVTKQHNPPSPICSGPTPALPTNVTLDLTGKLTGIYANSTLGVDISGFPFETYVRVTPDLSLVPGLTQESFGTGSGNINQVKTAVKTVGVETIDYTGSLNVQSKFGFGGQNLDFISSFSQLLISGSLRDPSTQISYEVPVPEPITIMGSIVTLSFIAGFKNRGKEKN